MASATQNQPYRGRIAPSPTGLLHLGHARTFWTAYQRALAAGGTLLLRNEDLDPQRSTAAFAEAMVEDLAWLGIRWQPPIITQSQRLPLYRAALEELLAAGRIYPCTCSRKDLAQMTQAPHEETDDEPVYNNRCRTISGPPTSALVGVTAAGEPTSTALHPHTNYRFRVPDGEAITFHDENLGPQSFAAGKDFGDILVWRKALSKDPADIGLPSYQLACVVDDADMQITEVVRGADLLKSTARQMLLQRTLGLPTPRYFHTELMRDAAGIRLAKRHDALSLRALRESGLTPEQIRTRF